MVANACYYGVCRRNYFISYFHSYIGQFSKDGVPDIIAGFGMAALVYAVQGAGNILEVITFPMFICAMAIVNCNKKIVK